MKHVTDILELLFILATVEVRDVPWMQNISEKKLELCERLADGLSLKNPGRIELTHLADDFRKRAKDQSWRLTIKSNQ